MSDERREEIIAAAQRLFAWYGYKKTTLENIAKDLNLTKTAIYNYFSGKEELFAVVVEKERREFFLRLEDVVNKESDPVKKLIAFFVQETKTIQEFVNLYDLTSGILQKLHKVVETNNVSYFEERKANLMTILQTGIDDGVFNIKEPDVLAESMVISFRRFTEQWMFESSNIKPVERVQILLETLLYGIVKREQGD